MQMGHAVTYRARSIPLGASNHIEQLRWKRYGGAVAIGIFLSNDCDPTCAEGTITPRKVTVRLAGVTPSPGSSLLVYCTIEITGPGFAPAVRSGITSPGRQFGTAFWNVGAWAVRRPRLRAGRETPSGSAFSA